MQNQQVPLLRDTRTMPQWMVIFSIRLDITEKKCFFCILE